MRIEELNTAGFEQAIATTDVPVVIDFYAPWCGPCQALAPFLEQLAGHFSGQIRFFKVNVDVAPALARRFQITGVPTLLFFLNGELHQRQVGMASPRALITKLEALATTAKKEPQAV